MNRALRGLVEDDESIALSAIAASGLSHLPSYESVSYRGATLQPAQLAQYKVGEVYTEPAFSSTTTAKAGAFKGNTYVVYQAKPKGGAGKDIQKYSLSPNEREVLYPPNTKFKVVSVEVAKKGEYENIIVLQEV
jgi:hypothetical protein